MKTTLVILISIIISAWIVPAISAEPERLTELRASYESAVMRAITPLQKAYVVKLQTLKSQYLKSEKLEDAMLIDAEIKKILTSDDSVTQATNKMEIVKAVWGDIASNHVVIVTNRVRVLLKPNSPPFPVECNALNVAVDPAPGLRKSLVITYTIDGKEKTQTFLEYSVVNFQVDFESRHKLKK